MDFSLAERLKTANTHCVGGKTSDIGNDEKKNAIKNSMVGGGSVYTAVQNAMLAARTEGLGCVLTTLHCLAEEEVKAALEIPDDWATLAMVPLGYPVGTGHGSITRQPPAVLAYDDAFGIAWS